SPRTRPPAGAVGAAGGRGKSTYQDRDKPAHIHFSNISAAKVVADAISTSLGPKGMDKMIQDGKGDVTITNDGATILKQMQVLHPAARMLVELSKAQDIEAGDGTTSVVIIAGSLLDSCTKPLQKGIHPTIISESFQKALEKGIEILTDMVVFQYSSLLSPVSVDAVMKVIDPATATSVDLRDIKILVEDLVLTQKVANSDMDNQIVVSDYVQMDGVLREERAYILNLSILRDVLSDLALHFLNKKKIMVVKDIEREDNEFICKTIGAKPVVHVDPFTVDMLGSAELAEEVSLNGSGKLIKITGCANAGKTVTIVVRGSSKLVFEEAEHSIHDALCVIRCLLALRLTEYSRTLNGMESYCICAFADAMEAITSTLAGNGGLNPISTGGVSNILEELVVQPLLVSVSALTLATETVRSILKIDDVVNTR
ncbi:hypothetical protein FD755_000113, partial [Muntiacus reevesi]